jgi:hypothetical protein
MGSNAGSAAGGSTGNEAGAVGNYPAVHGEAVVIVEEVLRDEVEGEVISVSGIGGARAECKWHTNTVLHYYTLFYNFFKKIYVGAITPTSYNIAPPLISGEVHIDRSRFKGPS